jgi:hypothetical protein
VGRPPARLVPVLNPSLPDYRRRFSPLYRSIFEAGFNIAKGNQDATKQDNGNADCAASFAFLAPVAFAKAHIVGD